MNKSRNKTEEKCDKIKSYVNGIINSNKLTDDDRKIKLKQFKNELSVISNQKLEIDNLIVKMEKEYDDLLNQWNTNKKFYLNKAIIEHIRDAIAHGNIKIQKTGQNGKENLLFIDDHKGKICLDLIVAIEDFENLFSEENINALREETVQKNKRY